MDAIYQPPFYEARPPIPSSPPRACVRRHATPHPRPPPASQEGWLWKSMSASNTRELLREQGIKAKKGLGQNFLTDDDVLARIVTASEASPGDLILEVGPGSGNLTKLLLAAGARVVAVEKDIRLAQELMATPDTPELVVLLDDVLQLEIDAIARDMTRGVLWTGDEKRKGA